MSYMRLDHLVALHPKFHAAGEAAAWLWALGIIYSQRLKSDGFIPRSALALLGYPARHVPIEGSVASLERVGLWIAEGDGWRIHDYLDYNYSSVQIERLSDVRRANGAKGGRSSKLLKQTEAKRSSTLLKHIEPDPIRSDPIRSDQDQDQDLGLLDTWLRILTSRYPKERITTGYRTETAFVEQFQADARDRAIVWAEMQANLDNQKQGHEWRVKGMVPSLEKWLREGRWRQRHDAAPASAIVTEKTAGTLAAAAEVLRGVRRDS